MTQPTDDQIWKMLDAWYQLTGRRIASTAAERDRDFAAMKRSLEAFERQTPAAGSDVDLDRRCDSGMVDADGYCIACNAIQGEACQAPRESRKNSRTTEADRAIPFSKQRLFPLE